MKVEYIDENTIIVFLNKVKVKDNLLLSNSYMETYFKTLFKTLKEKYQISINGYYNIKIYQDAIYGVIMEIKKECVDYFDYFDNQVDMKIDIEKECPVLYEVNNCSLLNQELCSYISIYQYHNHIYIKPKRTISQLDLGKIIENSIIVYGKSCKQILKCGKQIKSKYIFV